MRACVSLFIFVYMLCGSSVGWVQPVVSHWAWAEQGWLKSGIFNEHYNVTIRYEVQYVNVFVM